MPERGEDVTDHVAECERKIAALESRLDRAEARLAAMITIAAREATRDVVDRLRVALEDQ